MSALKNEKRRIKHPFFVAKTNNYLFITYIVTSKPKRISVAAGVVHIIILLDLKFARTAFTNPSREMNNTLSAKLQQLKTT